MFGYAPSGLTCDFFAYNASNQVWSAASSSFVDWADADFASYRTAAVEQGTSGLYSSDEALSSLTARYELRQRGATLALSTIFWVEEVSLLPTAPSAAAGSLYVTNAQVRLLPSMSAIPLTAAGTDPDALVTQVIAGVQAAMCRWLRRDFELHSALTEMHDGDGSRLLVANVTPIIEVTGIDVLGQDGQSWALDLDDLSVDKDAGLIEFHGRSLNSQYGVFPRGKQNVQLTYDCGWTSVPSDVRQGLCAWVAEECNKLSRDTSLSSEQISKYRWQGKETSDGESAVPPAVARRYLSSWRNLIGPYALDRK